MRFLRHCLDFNFRRNWKIHFTVRNFVEDYLAHVRSYWYEAQEDEFERF